MQRNTIEQEKLTVGKFTLESLTTGMYSDPMTIFREYIQNSCDSIDVAVESQLLEGKICNRINDIKKGKIHIILDKKNSEIIIEDNGTGIPSSEVWKILGDIGKSRKIFEEQRGFRGIGRLGGMSYCDELIFETSFKEEREKSIIKWDCKYLRDLLRPGEYEDYDIIDVMEEISFQTRESEERNKHYFKVILKNVNDEYPDLLDEEKVRSYISQNAPVPFNPQKFIYANKIKDDFRKFGFTIPEYSIFLNDDPNRLTKLYKSHVVARRDRGKVNHHDIRGYEIVKPISSDLQNSFVGWVGRRNKYEETIQIKDKEVSGIRLRKGNIQIGDNEILKNYFIEERYNHYFVGEIHILTDNVIPNARRDNFEKVGDYPLILNDIEKVTRRLSIEIRKNSEEKSIVKEIDKATKIIDQAKTKAKKGFSSKIQQDEIFNQIDEAKNSLEKISEKKGIDEEIVEQAKNKLEKIKELDNTVINGKCDNFILKNISSEYSRKERKVLCKVFEILDSILIDNDQIDESIISMIKNRILEAFK